MKSLQQKAKQLEGLIDTKDVTEWENDFLKGFCSRMAFGTSFTSTLSEKQLDLIDRIYNKHFA